MELGLPRETQQIDRVMEAFAARYMTCNSGLFVDDGERERHTSHYLPLISVVHRSSVHLGIQLDHAPHGCL